MSTRSNQAKVSVTTDDANCCLYTLNKDESLGENVKVLCKRFSMPSENIYGLKLLTTKDGQNVDRFITENNYKDIEDGQFLKLTLSVEMRVKRIFDHINGFGREKSFDDLYKLSGDPGFIKELVKQQKHIQVMDMLLKCKQESERAACIITILHLFKENCIDEIERGVVNEIIGIIKSGSSDLERLLAVAVLCQILYTKSPTLGQVKQLITDKVQLKELFEYSWNSDNRPLQTNTLQLMNAIAKHSNNKERQRIIVEEMSSAYIREKIFNCIASPKNTINDDLARELYIYQTLFLSFFYEEDLFTAVNTKNNAEFRLEEFYVEQDPHNLFTEFQDTVIKNQIDLSSKDEDIRNKLRLSTASASTTNSVNILEQNLISIFTTNNENIEISRLTLDCLRYYKNMHFKTFRKSLMEETLYETGLFVSAEDVTKLLGEILHIGKKPEKQCTFYQPLVFNIYLKYPLFPELFSRTMWLLSKTRNEMRARKKDDYYKVLKVLKMQIEATLRAKPMDFKHLTEEMAVNSYKKMSDEMERQRRNQWKNVYKTNPSIQEFKRMILSNNQQLIFEHRISVVQMGDKFPKLPIKRGKEANIFVKLSENKKKVYWNEYSGQDFQPQQNSFDVNDIRHLVIGIACPHVKDNSFKDHKRAFTLMVGDGNSEDLTLNFVAKDETTAKYWTDAFSLLLGKDNRSDLYMQELEILMEMDCALQLLEVQDLDLPKKEPKIPPLPPGYGPKPALLPKSPHLVNLRKQRMPSPRKE